MELKRRIFASLDDFLPPGSGKNMVGRNMANHFFFRALLRYGTFDEYHFFLSNRAHRNLFEQQHGPLFATLNVGDKIRLFDRIDLPDALAKYDYTVIHQSDHVTHMASVVRLRNVTGAQVPITAFIHSLSYPSYMTRYMELNGSDLSSSDAIICSSECGKEVVRKCLDAAALLGQEPSSVTLEVIPLGIDEQPHEKSSSSAREVIGIAKDEVVGLCFGRFSDFDKMDLFPLLQALKDVPGKRNKLILAGAIHDEEYFKILQLWVKALGLQKRVTVAIQPDDEKKRDLFAAADFFVSIADNPQETFGLTVLEAMHAGTPQIVSDFNGYRELVGDEAGIRVPTLWADLAPLAQVEALMDMRTLHRYLAQSICVDMSALKQALRTMYFDKSVREKYGKQSKERFENNFAHKKTIARLEAFWISQKEGYVGAAKSNAGLSMNIPRTFSHYVTQHILESDLVQSTPFAKQLHDASIAYPMLPAMAELLDSKMITKVVSSCFTPKAVNEIYELYTGNWRIQFLVMWMLKHDLLEIIPK